MVLMGYARGLKDMMESMAESYREMEEENGLDEDADIDSDPETEGEHKQDEKHTACRDVPMFDKETNLFVMLNIHDASEETMDFRLRYYGHTEFM